MREVAEELGRPVLADQWITKLDENYYDTMQSLRDITREEWNGSICLPGTYAAWPTRGTAASTTRRVFHDNNARSIVLLFDSINSINSVKQCIITINRPHLRLDEAQARTVADIMLVGTVTRSGHLQHLGIATAHHSAPTAPRHDRDLGILRIEWNTIEQLAVLHTPIVHGAAARWTSCYGCRFEWHQWIVIARHLPTYQALAQQDNRQPVIGIVIIVVGIVTIIDSVTAIALAITAE